MSPKRVKRLDLLLNPGSSLAMRFLCLALFLCLAAACGRPLTPNERAFVQDVQGDQVDPRRVRFHEGLWAAAVTYQRPIRPRLTCMERIFPPSRGETVTVQPGAMALFNHVYYREDLYLDDYMAEYPERINLYAAMLMAHEMTHVWQWQNRARTGYTPLKAASEHGRTADPYLFDPQGQSRFLDYGFEQQGALVEEYVCCRLLDPEAPRTRRMRAMISEAMPLAGLETAISRPALILPWDGAETARICH